MGSPEGEGAADEHPSRQVTLRAYCIDRVEATIDAYTACVTAGTCSRASGTQPQGDAAMSGIDWEQASSYCRFVGGRLPTEAEWEYAARGRAVEGLLAQRAFPWGSDAPNDCDRANWFRCLVGGRNDTRPVGSFPGAPAAPSCHALFDMAGNVAEFTADNYNEYPAATDAGSSDASVEELCWRDGGLVAPLCVAPDGTAPSFNHVLRGGARSRLNEGVESAVLELRAAGRASVGEPYVSPAVGFRCAYNGP